MGLIKGSAGIQKLLLGYPTVSDKYEVAPATLGGSANAQNGDIMVYTSTESVYERLADKASGSVEVAGVLLATNVKTPSVYPANTESVATIPGEAFNLMKKGFIALACADSSAPAPGSAVYYNPTSKKVSASSSSTKALTGWQFTGIWEAHGSDYIAEVHVPGDCAVSLS